MKCVDDFRLQFGKQELVPIIIGGMGVDISTAELALEAVAVLQCIGQASRDRGHLMIGLWVTGCAYALRCLKG